MIGLRRLTSIDRLMLWRREVIENVFGISPDASLLEANRRYYEEHIPDGSHIALVASVDGIDCGCGAVCFTAELPSPDNPRGKCAYLMNIYVRKEYREMGIAHRIVRMLIDEAIKHGCGKIYLETTADGRPVYHSLGFRNMQGMMKYCNNETR
ncbi:MAG: GNAT family N-acetyltransferase [Staphylococcus sp.]|nr:GNAT family N-acetyltransferase [Staphylococcus sp.]